MARIGIIINTINVKQRNTEKGFFDNMAYYGLRYIISEIDSEHTVEYTSFKNINNYEFCLYSFTSYYDVFNFVNEIKNIDVKTKIIVGGAGILNIYPIKKWVWAVCFGRGEGLINGIIRKENFPNVWYRDDDSNVEGLYEIGQQKVKINLKTPKDIEKKFEGLKENEVGCQKRCYFCQYSWKNKLDVKYEDYRSGYGNREDFFMNLDFNLKTRYLVTAIDGYSESTRYIINKPLKNKQIIEKLLERNSVDRDKSIQIKLYSIYAFPFEKNISNYYDELFYTIQEAGKSLNKPMCILLSNSHFVPMAMTPMEREPVNINDFKNIDVPKIEGKIKIVKPYTATSYISACEETIIQRFTPESKEYIFSKKYTGMTGLEKLSVIKEYYKKEISYQEKKIIPYIKYDIEKHINDYENRKKRS